MYDTNFLSDQQYGRCYRSSRSKGTVHLFG